MFLSNEEVEQLTGYKSPGWQSRWLDERGWVYAKTAGGRIRVSRAHAESMLGGQKAAKAPEPNWAAFETRM